MSAQSSSVMGAMVVLMAPSLIYSNGFVPRLSKVFNWSNEGISVHGFVCGWPGRKAGHVGCCVMPFSRVEVVCRWSGMCDPRLPLPLPESGCGGLSAQQPRWSDPGTY